MRPLARTTALLCASLAFACGSEAPDAPASPPERVELPVSEGLARTLRAFSPLPPVPPDPTNRVADDPRAALLGQALFFDTRLSANGAVSCATCHDPARGLSDGLSLAFGLAEGRRSTPTLWNAAYHRWLTWDGRADSLWMQALDPLEDPLEMGFSRTEVAGVIASDAMLRALWERVFGPLPDALPERISRARPARFAEPKDAPHAVRWAGLSDDERAAIDDVYVGAGKALAAYQRRLVRGDADFDRFVAALDTGDSGGLAALDASELRGLELFFGRAHCTLCHSGPNFSDSEFHNNALPSLDRGEADDAGRYDGVRVVQDSAFNAAGPHSDAPDGEAARGVRSLRHAPESWGEFRTPSLRNLAGRAPFMHQGQFPDLAAVIRFYDTLEGLSVRGHHQEQILQPLRLTMQERADLEAFLGTLEGAPADPALLAPPTPESLREAARED